MSTNVDKTNSDALNFEQALERLEAVVAEMESGELPLEATMKRFEEGMKLSKLCTRKLGETEKRIEVLMKEENENPAWKDITKDVDGTPELDLGDEF